MRSNNQDDDKDKDIIIAIDSIGKINVTNREGQWMQEDEQNIKRWKKGYLKIHCNRYQYQRNSCLKSYSR